MIGLDTSHAKQFTALLHDESHPFHVPGLRITAAFPGGSKDLALSASRVARFTKELREVYQVPMFDNLEDFPADLDGIFLESVDGRQHHDQFAAIARRGVPVFIDKPLAASFQDARKIASLAKEYGVPLMSSSALRFAEAFESVLAEGEDICAADIFAPMPVVEGVPGYFWYGIHGVEMLYRALGPGCRRILVAANAEHDVITAEWKDGRLATLRGNRLGNSAFGGTVHDRKRPRFFVIGPNDTPFYASLLHKVVRFLMTKTPPVDLEESLEIIRFLEAANESKERGGWIDV